MYCKYCGKKIDDDSTYCNGCGAKLSIAVNKERHTVQQPTVDVSTGLNNNIQLSSVINSVNVSDKSPSSYNYQTSDSFNTIVEEEDFEPTLANILGQFSTFGKLVFIILCLLMVVWVATLTIHIFYPEYINLFANL